MVQKVTLLLLHHTKCKFHHLHALEKDNNSFQIDLGVFVSDNDDDDELFLQKG